MKMRGMGFGLALVLALAIALLAAGSPLPPNEAIAQGKGAGPPAQRLCKPRLEWTSSGETRREAQRRAIDGWASAAAVAHGEAFTNWGVAGIARIACVLTPEGHRCRAAGSPCRDLPARG